MSRSARRWGAAVGTAIVALTAVLLPSARAAAVPVPPPPEVTVLPESAPYPVAQVRLTFVDPSRSAPARGEIITSVSSRGLSDAPGCSGTTATTAWSDVRGARPSMC